MSKHPFDKQLQLYTTSLEKTRDSNINSLHILVDSLRAHECHSDKIIVLENTIRKRDNEIVMLKSERDLLVQTNCPEGYIVLNMRGTLITVSEETLKRRPFDQDTFLSKLSIYNPHILWRI